MHGTSLPAPSSSTPSSAVTIVGAGAVGLACGIALARGGIETVLVGPAAPVRPGRTVALLDGSVRLLDALGVWPGLRERAAPLRGMRLVDATPSLFRPPPLTFHATEVGLPQFGFNIENGDLEGGLIEAARRTPLLTLVQARATAFRSDARSATVGLDTGEEIRSGLVVAADGRESRLRKWAGIGVQLRSWPQVALTTRLTHTGDHRGVSTEFHTAEGPFTLVPLPDGGDGTHRSSLVWVMRPERATERRQLDPARLAEAIERQSQRLLGSVTLDGPVGTVPIVTSVSRRVVAPRLVLIGEAAHALPPIGAQGMNLSLRDVETLGELFAGDRDGDLGEPSRLADYATARQADVGLRRLGVDLLNGSLLTRSLPVDLLRAAGLSALAGFTPLRRFAMKRGLGNGRDERGYRLPDA